MCTHAVISSIGGINIEFWFAGTELECKQFIRAKQEEIYENRINKIVDMVLTYVQGLSDQTYYEVDWDVYQVDSKYGSFCFNLEDKDSLLESFITGEYIADIVGGYYPSFRIIEKHV